MTKMRRVLDPYDGPLAAGRVICADEFGPLNLQACQGHTWRIETDFAAQRYFAITGTDQARHTEQAAAISEYMRWRNARAKRTPTSPHIQSSGPGPIIKSTLHDDALLDEDVGVKGACSKGRTLSDRSDSRSGDSCSRCNCGSSHRWFGLHLANEPWEFSPPGVCPFMGVDSGHNAMRSMAANDRCGRRVPRRRRLRSSWLGGETRSRPSCRPRTTARCCGSYSRGHQVQSTSVSVRSRTLRAVSSGQDSTGRPSTNALAFCTPRSRLPVRVPTSTDVSRAALPGGARNAR
jgi:hypothetical protein